MNVVRVLLTEFRFDSVAVNPAQAIDSGYFGGCHWLAAKIGSSTEELHRRKIRTVTRPAETWMGRKRRHPAITRPRAKILAHPGAEELSTSHGNDRASDPERAAETPRAIVRFRSIVVDEDGVVATITKKGPAEFSDFVRCFHPTRCFGVEISELLQLPVLFFR